jgi:hypothetical protein
MIARTLRQVGAKTAQQTRMASSKHSSLNGPGPFEAIYQTFMKNNVTYIGTILIGAVVVESVYGSATNYLWESVNRGVSGRKRCSLFCVEVVY